jgi:diguanylate cyclase (GGDEF)-like protein/PAS domain S-box-containing protein
MHERRRATETVSERDRIRRREHRAIALLLVFGLSVWILESLLTFPAVVQDTPLAPIFRHLNAQPLIIPFVGILCFLGYAVYITKILVDVRRAESELVESEERYRLLTHNSLTGIYIHRDGRLLYVNDRLAEMLGYSPDEVLGTIFWDLVHPEDRELLRDRDEARSMGREVVPRYEFRALCKSGHSKWMEVLASTIGYDGGTACMGNVADISERKEAEAERENLISDLTYAKETLRFQAAHDALTGLLNRAATLEKLAEELSRAYREKTKLAVIMADLDCFKNINDTYGHLGGDAVLREVARRISESVRPYDVVGRYGGEEIIIALPGCDRAGAVSFAERIREAIESRPVETDEGRIGVTASLGVAIAGDPQPRDPDTVVRDADRALYRAKQHGRNCVMTTEENPDRGTVVAPESPCRVKAPCPLDDCT